MKRRNQIIFKVATVAMLVSTISSGCKKDFFDLPDRNGIDSKIWNNAGAMQFLLNTTYDMVMPVFPYQVPTENYIYAADDDYISTTDGTSKKMIGVSGTIASNDIKYIATKYQGTNYGDNRYFNIARCNNAIEGIPTSTLNKSITDPLLGQFYALRAMTYFELVKLYGAVPLVLTPQNPESPSINKPRSSASDCFKQIVTDLDSAINKLPPTWDDGSGRGKLTRGAVAALKGKALLYWASPQFNPQNNPSHPYDASRWQVAYDACKAAYLMCKTDGYGLLGDYSQIFQTEGTSNPEAIIVRSYSNTVAKRGQNSEYNARPSSEGGNGGAAFCPTWNLVKAYAMQDGTPIAQAGSNYNQAMFWKNRDPRFYATIAYNGSDFKLSGKAGRRQWCYTGTDVEGSKLTKTGFYSKKFCDPNLLAGAVQYKDDFGGNGFDWIEMRFAEVLLNYAECANAIGNLSEAKDLVKLLRIRAGVQQGTKNYGLDYATDIPTMQNLMMNEREVEFALEGKRFDDLRRTRTYDSLSGTTVDAVIWTPKNKAFLETINSSGYQNRDTVNVNNSDTFNKYFSFTVKPIVATPMNISVEYYFFAFPSQFLNSSPTLEQTIGWDGGTFDPLAN
nr:RagB/SusD family nutrient uptake outer membrane protein [uncultured Pedobacter sp.]